MDQTTQDHLFDVKVNASGKLYLRKFAGIARAIILVGLFISLIHLSSTVLRHLTYKSYDLSGNRELWLEYQLLPYYTAIYCILFYPQMYFYWQTTKYLRKGLECNDEETFNKAFRSLYRYAVFGIATVLLSVLSYGFELYEFIKYYRASTNP